MTAPDLLAVLTRADHRWATKQADDPADPEYLRHLAAALQPVLDQPGPTTAAPAAGVLKQWKDRAAGADELAAELVAVRRELDATRLELGQTLLKEECARRDLTDARGDTRRQVDRAVQANKATTDHRDGAIDDLRIDLAAARRNLGRLVDAINEEWHPDDDHTTQVDRAVQLVAAAHDQLQQRHDDGRHVCQWPRNTNTGRIGKCQCGKGFPKTAKAGLTGTTPKGDTA